MQVSCDKVLACGHPCGGFNGEKKCLPCLEPSCIEKMDKKPKCKKDDYCPICYAAGFGQEPCVNLDCGHILHLGCVKS